MADLSHNTKAARQKPSLEAVAEDEERREKAERTLVRTLQSYINKLDNANARDANRETEIFCDYARENYASRAAASLEGMLSTDPRVLFEFGDLTERRDLAGLPTIGDVFDLVKRVKVRRPDHWPDPIAYRPDESPKMREVLRSLTRREHKSFKWLLEEPWGTWFRPQIRDCVIECVRAKREEYEQRFPPPAVQTESAPPEPATLANRETRKRRYELLNQFRAKKGLSTMPDLARHLRMSVTAIRGIVTGDRTRYSEATMLNLLNGIGVSRDDW